MGPYLGLGAAGGAWGCLRGRLGGRPTVLHSQFWKCNTVFLECNTVSLVCPRGHPRRGKGGSCECLRGKLVSPTGLPSLGFTFLG